jgi:hypothetical protein
MRVRQAARTRPAVGSASAVGDPEARSDAAFVVAWFAVSSALTSSFGIGEPSLRLQVEVQHPFLLATEHRQDPVGGQPGERLCEIEVVGELRASLLARPDP